ncbi:MAG: DUF721 domain-containing protein [Pirellulales bacterium]|nr:DUF721 domain-containing protein [Pirellulales bacterium]
MTRRPQHIGNVLAELMARQGYARQRSPEAYEAAWRQAAGELVAGYTRVGSLRRGTLEVIVAHSTLVQELGFQKSTLLNTLAGLLPEDGIRDLRFRVGSIG